MSNERYVLTEITQENKDGSVKKLCMAHNTENIQECILVVKSAVTYENFPKELYSHITDQQILESLKYNLNNIWVQPGAHKIFIKTPQNILVPIEKDENNEYMIPTFVVE